jgi:hypothetical protein
MPYLYLWVLHIYPGLVLMDTFYRIRRASEACCTIEFQNGPGWWQGYQCCSPRKELHFLIHGRSDPKCRFNEHVRVSNRLTGQLSKFPQHVFKPLSICHDLKSRTKRTLLALVIPSLCTFVCSCQSVPLTYSIAYMTHEPDIKTLECQHNTQYPPVLFQRKIILKSLS